MPTLCFACHPLSRTYPLTPFLKEGGTGILFRDPLFLFLQERVPAARQAG